MFDFLLSEVGRLAQAIKVNKYTVTDEQFILNEINNFKTSQKRREMLNGEKYYIGKHDILNKLRTVIGEDGELIEVQNLPNNRIVDNQYNKWLTKKQIIC